MSMKYVRTGFRTGAEHIHLGNPLDSYTAVGYRWPCLGLSKLLSSVESPDKWNYYIGLKEVSLIRK